MHKIQRQDVVDFLQTDIDWHKVHGMQKVICKGDVDLDNSIWAMM